MSQLISLMLTLKSILCDYLYNIYHNVWNKVMYVGKTNKRWQIKISGGVDNISTVKKVSTVAILGNPNCGKTSIFNALTKSKHHVGNWAGVTVDKRYGYCQLDNINFKIVDLPGSYSILAQSEDEKITVDFLIKSDIDIIINVLDASNLERNLYLTTQLIALNKPLIYVLNMIDDAERQGVIIDISKLQNLLKGTVVSTIGNRAYGIDKVKQTILNYTKNQKKYHSVFNIAFNKYVEDEIAKITNRIQNKSKLSNQNISRWLAINLLENTISNDILLKIDSKYANIIHQQSDCIQNLEKKINIDLPTYFAEQRYIVINKIANEAIRYLNTNKYSITKKIDNILTHKLFGIPIFIAIVSVMYGITFIFGQYPKDWILNFLDILNNVIIQVIPNGAISSLLIDGIIPGVGSVLSLLPMIMILMGCISFLEDTGYMARIAFIMDRPMHIIGLHGKSFIPLIMGTGCNVPGIQATRIIEAKSDRLITIVVSPLISCSARLQVYVLIASTFFKPMQAIIAVIAIHLVGFTLIIAISKLLRTTVFKHEATPFIMELPPYRIPTIKSVISNIWTKGQSFLTKAGTVILSGVILVWVLSNYPGMSNKHLLDKYQLQINNVISDKNQKLKKEKIKNLELSLKNEIMQSSFAAKFGHIIQPILSPILDPNNERPEAWKDGVALTVGLISKEIVISTMGILNYDKLNQDLTCQKLGQLQKTLKSHSGFTPLTAFAFMIIVMLYTPCLGVIGAIRQETRSVTWTSFSILYGLVLAWLLAWIIIKFGHILGFS